MTTDIELFNLAVSFNPAEMKIVYSHSEGDSHVITLAPDDERVLALMDAVHAVVKEIKP